MNKIFMLITMFCLCLQSTIANAEFNREQARIKNQIEFMFGVEVESVELSNPENPYNLLVNLLETLKEVHITTKKGIVFNCLTTLNLRETGLLNCRVYNDTFVPSYKTLIIK